MASRLFDRIYNMNPWHFLWIGIIASELFTITISFIASKVLWGRLSQETIIIGLIDSLLVSFPIIVIIIHFVAKINKGTQESEHLRQEIAKRKLLEIEREKLLVKLSQSHKMESIGTLATGIAHEINQPLTFIKIVFEAIKRDITNDQLSIKELVEDCDASLAQVVRITSIINHLLNFSRDDPMSMYKVGLGEILENALLLFSNRIKLKNIELEVTIKDDLPQINGNSIRLEQVFINLFQNSIDALKEIENARIAVSILKENNYVKILFSDNGKGIPAEFHAKIFEPFFTTKEVGEGTGLGLAMVYNIIKEHKGEISYVGEEMGSTFLITIPVSNDDINSGEQAKAK